MKKKVAIQGIAGSYHDIAARNYFEVKRLKLSVAIHSEMLFQPSKKILPFWE